jgi:hypothetical protein
VIIPTEKADTIIAIRNENNGPWKRTLSNGRNVYTSTSTNNNKNYYTKNNIGKFTRNGKIYNWNKTTEKFTQTDVPQKLNKNQLVMNVLLNVSRVSINQPNLIRFLQGQNANSVKRHLNALKNRTNSQKKAYINAQLGHQDMFRPKPIQVNSRRLVPIISNLQKAGLVLDKDFTRNQLARNVNTIGNIGTRLKAAGMYRNPYLRLLFTATNKVKQSLNRDPTGKNLEQMVARAKSAQQAFMVREFTGFPRIPASRMGNAAQHTLNLNKQIRAYFGNNVGNVRNVTSKPDFVQFLQRRGPKKNGETLNSVHREYVQEYFSKLFSTET